MQKEDSIVDFIEQLESLCNSSVNNADEHAKRGNINCLGFDYFGRSFSCLIGIKTLLFAMDLSSLDPDFGKKFFDKVLSPHIKGNTELATKYINESYMAVRFVLFQNFYSQTEFTYRIIQRKLFPSENKNPFRFFVEKYGVMTYGVMTIDFVNFLNAIRNTIHNNGFYYPLDKNPNFEFEFKEKTFIFEYGKPINDFTMQDILDLIGYMLEENRKLFKIDDLALIDSVE